MNSHFSANARNALGFPWRVKKIKLIKIFFFQNVIVHEDENRECAWNREDKIVRRNVRFFQK